MDHPRKAARNGQIKPKKEATTTNSVMEPEPSKAFGGYNFPQISWDTGIGIVGFNISPAGFWSFFFPIPF